MKSITFLDLSWHPPSSKHLKDRGVTRWLEVHLAMDFRWISLVFVFHLTGIQSDKLLHTNIFYFLPRQVILKLQWMEECKVSLVQWKACERKICILFLVYSWRMSILSMELHFMHKSQTSTVSGFRYERKVNSFVHLHTMNKLFRKLNIRNTISTW